LKLPSCSFFFFPFFYLHYFFKMLIFLLLPIFLVTQITGSNTSINQSADTTRVPRWQRFCSDQKLNEIFKHNAYWKTKCEPYSAKNRQNDKFSSLHRLMAALSPKESKEVWKHLCKTGQVPELYKEQMCSNKEGKTTPADKGTQCCTDARCSSYRGNLNTTVNGLSCMPWSQLPKWHSSHPSKRPEAGLDGNYCRNPKGLYQTWCYVIIDGRRKREKCNMRPCEKITTATIQYGLEQTRIETAITTTTTTAAPETTTTSGAESGGKCKSPKRFFWSSSEMWKHYYCGKDNLYHGCSIGSCWKQCTYGERTWCYTGYKKNNFISDALNSATDLQGRESNQCNMDQATLEVGQVCSESKDVSCMSKCYKWWIGRQH